LEAFKLADVKRCTEWTIEFCALCWVSVWQLSQCSDQAASWTVCQYLAGVDLCLLQNIEIGCGANPGSCSGGSGCYFIWVKWRGACSLTFVLSDAQGRSAAHSIMVCMGLHYLNCVVVPSVMLLNVYW